MTPELRFLHRLALALGRTVRQLERELSAAELADWIRYDNVEPFGSVRDNWHAAVIASMVLAPHSKNGKPPPLSDFFYTDPETAQKRREAATLAWLDARTT